MANREHGDTIQHNKQKSRPIFVIGRDFFI